MNERALLSSCVLLPVASFRESIHLISIFLFFCCLYFFQYYYLFQRPLPSHDVPAVRWLQFCCFLLPVIVQIYYTLGPICSSFWSPRVSLEFTSNAVFQNAAVRCWQMFNNWLSRLGWGKGGPISSTCQFPQCKNPTMAN